MTETQDPKLLWFNFLKVFTRALVQINLYKPDHPQVKLALTFISRTTPRSSWRLPRERPCSARSPIPWAAGISRSRSIMTSCS